MRFFILSFMLLVQALTGAAQYTRQDTLRGSNGRGRDWWDVKKYELEVKLDTVNKSITGSVLIDFIALMVQPTVLQLDLQDSMIIDAVLIAERRGEKWVQVGQAVPKKDGNVWWLDTALAEVKFLKNGRYALNVYFHGRPSVAKNPPWDGGLIWSHDSLGQPWIAVACQGMGASCWWPCKDYQGDEPNDGASMLLSTTPWLPAKIGNGSIGERPDGRLYYFVKNPINSYNTTFYLGSYANYRDTLHGEKGVLELDFHPLKYNLEKARKHWAVVKDMLRCYEYWMGPYPFYEDGYKLVEAPYAGMEHQSAVAYGNEYKMGFRGWDRGGTGIGLSFDEIIIHESGHEWFGNSITAQDPADNWLHEGFATYAESLFVEWIMGKDSAFMFTKAQWRNIRNDRPVIGDYGVSNEGSGDRYAKGAAVVHMVRMMLNDDKRFRQLLRGLNRDFYHKIVTSKQVEEYIAKYVSLDLRAFFDIYLRTTNKPRLEWCRKKGVLYYRWENVVPGFRAPLELRVASGIRYPTTDADSGSIEVHVADIIPVKVLAAGWYNVVEVDF